MNLQYNFATGKPYEGKNQTGLILEKESKGYKSNVWLTFCQARECGLKISKGAHGVYITKRFEKVFEKVNEKEIERSRPTGTAVVFNLDQTQKFAA